MSACYPGSRRKTRLDGSAQLCFCPFSTAVYGCNNKANFMTPTRGNGNSEREKNKVSINIQRKVSSGGGFYGTKQSLQAKYGRERCDTSVLPQRQRKTHHSQLKPTLWRLSIGSSVCRVATRAWGAVHERFIPHEDRSMAAHRRSLPSFP